MTYLYYANIITEGLNNVSKHLCLILFQNMNALNFYREKPKFPLEKN